MRSIARANERVDVLGNSDVSIPDWLRIGTAGMPAFQNSWVHYDAVEFAEFWRDSSGIVRLRGLVKDGTVTAIMFTLPVGFRPGRTCRFPVNSAGAFGIAYVDNVGNVVLGAGSNTYVDLAPIAFRAEA